MQRFVAGRIFRVANFSSNWNTVNKETVKTDFKSQNSSIPSCDIFKITQEVSKNNKYCFFKSQF